MARFVAVMWHDSLTSRSPLAAPLAAISRALAAARPPSNSDVAPRDAECWEHFTVWRGSLIGIVFFRHSWLPAVDEALRACGHALALAAPTVFVEGKQVVFSVRGHLKHAFDIDVRNRGYMIVSRP